MSLHLLLVREGQAGGRAVTGVWRGSALLLDARWLWAGDSRVHPDVAEVALASRF